MALAFPHRMKNVKAISFATGISCQALICFFMGQAGVFHGIVSCVALLYVLIIVQQLNVITFNLFIQTQVPPKMKANTTL